MLPKEQKALYLDSKFGSFVVAGNNVPKPSTGEILVKIMACGLNPIDWKIQKYGVFIKDYPVVLGGDIAGDVVEVGEGEDSFVVGDRVLAKGIASNTGGAFQQYALAISRCTAKIPPQISYDQAATFPSTLSAAYLSLYNQQPHGLGFTSPLESSGRGKYAGTPLVIFGGATTVGYYTIQLAKLSGFSPIIATASLKHETRLRDLGVHKVIDRNAPFTILRDEIRATTSIPIKYVIDTVSVKQTQQMGNDILATGGYLQLVQEPEATFSPDKHIGFTKGLRFLPENQAAYAVLYTNLYGLLEKEDLKPSPLEVIPGGLAGIRVGLERLARDEVSGGKLVAHPDEIA